MIPHSKPMIGPEEMAAVTRVLESGRLAQGPEVERFEAVCAAVTGRHYAVAVSSGTAALHLALGALGVTLEEPVAVPSYCCASLVTAIRLHGAIPLLCDIGDDFNLVPQHVPQTCRAAIVPSLFGAPARVPNTPLVVEDIAQALGGPAGRTAPVAVASFYATKLVTTGEGGVVLTDDEAMAAYVRDRRDYDNRDDFQMRYPYKMTEFQAALGTVQMGRLPEFIRRRREIASYYSDHLHGLPLQLPDAADHVYFRYVVQTERRDELEAWLQARGIEAKRPVYRPAHHYLRGHYPRSQQAHECALSLPIYPALEDGELQEIIAAICAYWESRRDVCTGLSNTGPGPILQSA